MNTKTNKHHAIAIQEILYKHDTRNKKLNYRNDIKKKKTKNRESNFTTKIHRANGNGEKTDKKN